MERTSKKRDVKREMRTNTHEEPAKVYRPRTLAPKLASPDTESETPTPHVADNGEEMVQVPRKSTREVSSRRSSREDEPGGGGSYKPRTLRLKNTEEVPLSSRFAPDSGDSLPGEEAEQPEYRPKRSRSREEYPADEGYPSRRSRFEGGGERSAKSRFSGTPSRTGVKRSEAGGERADRFGARPSRLDKPAGRKERGGKTEFSRSAEDFGGASGYKSRTFRKKHDDEATPAPKPRREQAKAEKAARDENELVRLNKYVANSGLCSRREADEMIQSGLISVNGEVITQLGTKVNPNDEICYKGKTLDAERKVYILLNKPKDYITTVDDPHAKRTVMELIEGACEERVYPVGRLDRNSTGVLLLTNDGEMTKRLTHPSFMKKKIYYVELDKKVSVDDMERIAKGVEVDGELLTVDTIDYTEGSDGTEVGVEIHTGQNRVVRRIFESLFYRVVRLDRVYFAGLTKKNLPRGKWRFLTQKEINMLRMNRF